MSSAQKAKHLYIHSKQEKKNYRLKVELIRKGLSPTVSSKTSPIRIIKTIKSQSNIYYQPKMIPCTPIPVMSASPCTITIKSVEKKVKLIDEEEEPSPIVSTQAKNFFSMTEEEIKELRLILKDFKK